MWRAGFPGCSGTQRVAGESLHSASVIERAVKMTLHEKPPAATHWSARMLAKAPGDRPESTTEVTAVPEPSVNGTNGTSATPEHVVTVVPPRETTAGRS